MCSFGCVVTTSALTLFALAGCSDGIQNPQPTTPTTPASTESTISLGLDGAWSITSNPADRLVRDSTGAYFCVLKRPDDLADLRAQFNQRPGQ